MWKRVVQRVVYGVRQQSTPLFRIVLVLVAVVDLLFRSGDGLLSLVVSGVSLAIGTGVLNVTQWLLFVAALAVIAPRLYPPPLRDLTNTVPLRLIVAATGTGIAIVLTHIDGLADAGLFVVIAIAFFVAVTATLRLNGVEVFTEESPLVSGLDWFALQDGIAQKELADAKDYDGWRRSFALGVFAVATHLVLFAPILIAGIVVMILVGTFPIPDVLVIAYVLGGFVASRIDRLSAPPATLQVDDYLLTFARQATNGIHSMFVVLFFGIGIFVTVMTPLVALRPATGLLLIALRPPIIPVLSWNVVGLYALYLAGAVYGLWFWLCMAPRIAAFLERWSGEHRKTSLKARPRSLLLPSLIVTVVATAGLANGFLGENRYAFAVAWPVLAVGIGWVVHRTRQRHPTVARREDLTVVGAVLVAFFTLWSNLAILSNDLGVLLSPTMGLICGIILYVGAIGRVSRYGDRHDRRYGATTDDERRFALPVYLAIGGLFALLTTGYLSGSVEVLLLVGGVTLVVSSVALGVTKYYRL